MKLRYNGKELFETMPLVKYSLITIGVSLWFSVSLILLPFHLLLRGNGFEGFFFKTPTNSTEIAFTRFFRRRVF